MTGRDVTCTMSTSVPTGPLRIAYCAELLAARLRYPYEPSVVQKDELLCNHGLPLSGSVPHPLALTRVNRSYAISSRIRMGVFLSISPYHGPSTLRGERRPSRSSNVISHEPGLASSSSSSRPSVISMPDRKSVV